MYTCTDVRRYRRQYAAGGWTLAFLLYAGTLALLGYFTYDSLDKAANDYKQFRDADGNAISPPFPINQESWGIALYITAILLGIIASSGLMTLFTRFSIMFYKDPFGKNSRKRLKSEKESLAEELSRANQKITNLNNELRGIKSRNFDNNLYRNDYYKARDEVRKLTRILNSLEKDSSGKPIPVTPEMLSKKQQEIEGINRQLSALRKQLAETVSELQAAKEAAASSSQSNQQEEGKSLLEQVAKLTELFTQSGLLPGSNNDREMGNVASMFYPEHDGPTAPMPTDTSDAGGYTGIFIGDSSGDEYEEQRPPMDEAPADDARGNHDELRLDIQQAPAASSSSTPHFSSPYAVLTSFYNGNPSTFATPYPTEKSPLIPQGPPPGQNPYFVPKQKSKRR